MIQPSLLKRLMPAIAVVSLLTLLPGADALARDGGGKNSLEIWGWLAALAIPAGLAFLIGPYRIVFVFIACAVGASLLFRI